MVVTTEPFGFTSKGEPVNLITICPKNVFDSAQNPSVKICTLGAAIVSCKIPGGSSQEERHMSDVVLGYETAKDYERNTPYLGVIVGRVAGRIQEGRFSSPDSGDVIQVTKNLQNVHCLHGGTKGLSFVLWTIRSVDHQSVLLEYVSPEGADGFPGQLTVQVEYTFHKVDGEPEAFELHIAYKATLSSSTTNRVSCPVNLTNHAYWNLAGHREGRAGLSRHNVYIRASRYVELRPVDLIPTGRVLPIPTDSPLDFRQSRSLGPGLESLNRADARGYDDYYVLDSDCESTEPAVIVTEPGSRRRMRVYTDQPGLQLYTGFYLDPNKDPIGKEGHRYTPFSGFCVETQGYPDACNQPDFPAVMLQSGGAPYIQETSFRFDCI
ncbi:Aldose 1-epimerase [Fasciola hepatica]|uniref:Aldose 1-epimerase n=1 Tax=Fasciola hepatica TaxID=6192 RepID=A0A2H1C6C3_FASHE|nr:Aldose 1-epimerase [Fasciola hepatica]